MQARYLKRFMEPVKYVPEQKQTSYPIFGHGRSNGNKINDDDKKQPFGIPLGHASFKSCFNVSYPSLEIQGALKFSLRCVRIL